MKNNLDLYDIFRPMMKTGDLLSYRTEGPISQMIRWWSPGINHSGMVLDLDQYRGERHRRWTLEATGAGVRVAYLSRLLEETSGDVYWHALKPEFDHLRIAIGCFALEQSGVTKYDFASLFKSAFGYVSADLKKLFCSELIFMAWRAAGICTGTKAPRPSELPNLGVTLAPVKIIEYQKPDTAIMTVEP